MSDVKSNGGRTQEAGGRETSSATGNVNPAPLVQADDVEFYVTKNDSGLVKKQPSAANVGEVANDSDPDIAAAQRQLQEEEDKTPCCSKKVLLIALPNILLPLLYGYNIGLVGVYSTLYKWGTDCELFKREHPCETLTPAKCQWGYATDLNGTNTTRCTYRDRDTCSLLYSTEGTCNANSVCTWDYSGKTCGNKVGYTSIKSGLFAGAMIIGAMVGSLLAGTMTKKLNYRLTFLIVSIVAIIGSVLTHIATGIFQYWLLFVARIILGFAMGWQAVAAPAYVAIFSPRPLVKTLGTFFQVSIVTGIFIAAIVGIGIGQSIKYDGNANVDIQGRMQGFICIPTFLEVLSIGLYFICKDVHQNSELDQSGDEGNDREDQKKYTWCQMIGPLLIGLCMSATLQLTGINAVMNFAPTIMGNLGLAPLVGNLVVMGWNCVTAFVSIPLSRVFSMRTLFLACSGIGAVACVFLCGVPVYPGVTKNVSAMEGVAITGFAIFIGLYEFGTGPCFFVLAGDVFPASFRPTGQSITVALNFVFNVIINICYPIAVEGISGGPSGDQNKGQAIAFIFFGGIGCVAFIVEYFFLYPWGESKEDHEQVADDDGAKEMRS